MTTALAHREQPTGGALAMWDAEQIHVLRTLICPDANDAEFVLFGQVCQRTGLDPFAKQIYAIKRKGKLTIQTGIDGFRLQAQRSHDYAGQEGPQWCGEDGIWRDAWLSKDPPAAARVGVYRKGWTRPVWGVATWAEYAQIYNGQPTDMWARMPSNQLAKCAESQALRKAFPAELSGLYTPEEMDQATSDGAPIPMRVVPKTADITPPPTVAPEPADEVTRQKFEANWTKGIARAIAAGIEPDEKPGADATKNELRKAQAELLQAIQAREALNAELVERIAAVRKVGGPEVVKDVDPATCTSTEIHEMLSTLAGMLAAAPEADDAAF